MGRELEEILRQQVAQPANSCVSESGVSFIDQVILPLYEVISAVCLLSVRFLCLACDLVYLFIKFELIKCHGHCKDKFLIITSQYELECFKEKSL